MFPSARRPIQLSKKGGKIHCVFANCNTDNQYTEGARFISFPKPCNEYRNEQIKLILGENIDVKHETNECSLCSKCKRWMHLSRRYDKFKNLTDAAGNYVCLKHFLTEPGQLPNEDDDPFPANADLEAIAAKRRAPSRDRSNVPAPTKRSKNTVVEKMKDENMEIVRSVIEENFHFESRGEAENMNEEKNTRIGEAEKEDIFDSVDIQECNECNSGSVHVEIDVSPTILRFYSSNWDHGSPFNDVEPESAAYEKSQIPKQAETTLSEFVTSFNRASWAVTKKAESAIFYNIRSVDRADIVNVTVKVTKDFKCDVFVLGKQWFQKGCSKLSGVKSAKTLKKFLLSLEQFHMCGGINETNLIEAFLKIKDLKKAYFCKQSTAVRSISCKGLTKGKRCRECVKYAKYVRTVLNHSKKKKQKNSKEQNNSP